MAKAKMVLLSLVGLIVAVGAGWLWGAWGRWGFDEQVRRTELRAGLAARLARRSVPPGSMSSS